MAKQFSRPKYENPLMPLIRCTIDVQINNFTNQRRILSRKGIASVKLSYFIFLKKYSGYFHSKRLMIPLSE